MPRKSKHVEVKQEEKSTLPAHLEDQRTRVTIGPKVPTNVRVHLDELTAHLFAHNLWLSECI